MRIKEEFKKSGYFWLPSTPEKKIPGTLFISDGGRIELEVIGLFDESIEGLNKLNSLSHRELKRIIGYIETHGLITLDDCFYKQASISFGCISKSLVYVNRVFLGVGYEENEIVTFNTFLFSIEGIDEWVGITGLTGRHLWENDTISETIISYSPPEEISLNINNGMKLLITFGRTIPGFSIFTEAKITQKTYFKLVSDKECPLSDFISIAYKINTFLCFAVDKTVCIKDILVTSNTIKNDIGNGESKAINISVYYKSRPYSKEEPKIDVNAMLFKFQQIQINAEKIINNWINAYEKIDSTLYLYFSTKAANQNYIENDFLALVQGLETYHRRISNEKLMDGEVFKKLVDSIVNQCPEENKEWLSGRLTHGNEISLTQRIKRVIEPFKEIIGTSKERGKLIRSIVDTRNYLTHYDEDLKEKAANGKKLWLLCNKLEAFFQLHFLQVLGFTNEEIKSVLDNSYELRQKLNSTDLL
jgi:hypothetical protein